MLQKRASAGASGAPALLRDEPRTVEERIHRQDEELAALKKYSDNMQLRFLKIERSNKTLKSANAQLQSANEKLQDANEQLQGAIGRLKSARAGAEAKITALEAQLAERSRQLEEARKRTDEAEGKLAKATVDLVYRGEDIADLQKGLDEVMKAREGEMRDARRQLAAKDKEIAELKSAAGDRGGGGNGRAAAAPKDDGLEALLEELAESGGDVPTRENRSPHGTTGNPKSNKMRRDRRREKRKMMRIAKELLEAQHDDTEAAEALKADPIAALVPQQTVPMDSTPEEDYGQAFVPGVALMHLDTKWDDERAKRRAEEEREEARKQALPAPSTLRELQKQEEKKKRSERRKKKLASAAASSAPPASASSARPASASSAPPASASRTSSAPTSRASSVPAFSFPPAPPPTSLSGPAPGAAPAAAAAAAATSSSGPDSRPKPRVVRAIPLRGTRGTMRRVPLTEEEQMELAIAESLRDVDSSKKRRAPSPVHPPPSPPLRV